MLQQSYEELVANVKAGDTQTANMEKWDPATWPATELKGVGTYCAPRGALAHWVKIRCWKTTVLAWSSFAGSEHRRGRLSLNFSTGGRPASACSPNVSHDSSFRVT
jgi:hypothetical protein